MGAQVGAWGREGGGQKKEERHWGDLTDAQVSRTDHILEEKGQAMALAQSVTALQPETPYRCISYTPEQMRVPTCQSLGKLWAPPTSSPTQLWVEACLWLFQVPVFRGRRP